MCIRDRNDPEVISSRKEMLGSDKTINLVSDCEKWPGPILKRHNDANLLIHKLCFLSEIGLRRTDPSMGKIAEMAMSSRDEAGPFKVLTHLYERFGGSGKDEMAWFLCDAPTLVYTLATLGYQDDERVLKARDYLVSLVDDNGWRCHVSRELGRMRGPGGKELECPYSTLLVLKLISAYPGMKNVRGAKIGIDTILDLWTDRKKRKPFLFAMGTDFHKLKLPLIWYDILHVTEVLSRFEYARKDERLEEMTDVLLSRADANGLYTPESVWMAWKGWDFSQKKEPSQWLTFRIINILKRMNSH
jgi:hypothetical protein